MDRATWSEEDKRQTREHSVRFLDKSVRTGLVYSSPMYSHLGVLTLQRLVETRQFLVEENLKMMA